MLDAADEEGPGAARGGPVIVASMDRAEDGPGRLVVGRDDLAGLRRTLEDEVRSRGDEHTQLITAVDEAERAVSAAAEQRQAASAARARAEGELATLRGLADALARAEEDLATAQAERAAAEQALVAAQADLADFEAARGAVEWAMRDTQAGLERHRAVGGEDSSASVGDAGLLTEIARVEEVARQVAAERAEAEVALDALLQGRDEAARADQELAELVDTHRARLAFLTVDEPTELRAAIEAYEQAAAGAPIDSAAMSIAEQWAELDRRSAELAATEPPRPTTAEIQRAQHRVTEANRMLAEEREAARLASLSDRARAEIEAAQEEVLAAEEAGNGHRGAERLATAKDRLATLLEEAGFGSYLDYVVSGQIVDPRQDRKVAAAQNIVRRAESQLRELQARGTPTPERLRIEEERRTLVRLATDVLGFSPTGHVEDVLRAQPALDPELTTRLIEVLGTLGVRPTDRPLFATATAWIAGWEEARKRHQQIEAELATAERRLAAARATGAGATWDSLIAAAQAAVERAANRERHANRLATSLVEAMEVESRADTVDPDLAVRVQALASLRERLARRFQAELDAANTALAAAAARQQEADAALVEAEDALDPVLGADWEEADVSTRLARMTEEATAAAASSVAAQGAWEAAVAARDEARERLAAQPGGTPPDGSSVDDVLAGVGWLARARGADTVVLVDPFDVEPSGVDELLDGLARLAADVRVVYLTEAPEVLAGLTGAPGVVGAAQGESSRGSPARHRPGKRRSRR